MSRRRNWPTIAAIVVIVLVGMFILGQLAPVAGRLWTRLRPGATVVLAIDSAHPFDEGFSGDEARRRTIDALRGRLEKIAPNALFVADQDRLTVQLTRGASPERVTRLLTRTGRLEFKVVDDGSVYMTHAAEQLAAQRADDVDVAHDEWSEKSGGALHDDIYLHARDRDAIKRAYDALAVTLPLPADHALAFEHKDDEWRSYYLFKRIELTGDSIQDLDVSWDNQSGRPEVSISFNRDGAQRFEALTARTVGRKLAILLEGGVQAAPVIEGKIAGGRARITMGGYSDPLQLQNEAKDLVAVLRTGGLAAPVTLVEVRPQR